MMTKRTIFLLLFTRLKFGQVLLFDTRSSTFTLARNLQKGIHGKMYKRGTFADLAPSLQSRTGNLNRVQNV